MRKGYPMAMGGLPLNKHVHLQGKPFFVAGCPTFPKKLTIALLDEGRISLLNISSVYCELNIKELVFIMLEFYIYPLISKIIPSTVKSKHATLCLEHFCLIKIIESERKYILEIVRNLPYLCELVL